MNEEKKSTMDTVQKQKMRALIVDKENKRYRLLIEDALYLTHTLKKIIRYGEPVVSYKTVKNDKSE